MRIADARLGEAEVLRDRGHFAAAIFLAGQAVECYLKAAICKSLDWDDLLGVFKSHDLLGLLKYSGYDRELRANPDLLESFSRLSTLWKGGSVRYELPEDSSQSEADDFFKWVSDPTVGVIPWFRSRIV